MNKIKLPPCESAGPEGACFWAVIGTMCGFREIPAGCPRYVPASGNYPTGFDALAAAVRKAGLFYELKDPYPNKDADQCQVEMVTQPRFRGWRGVKIEGPTPTAALLAACLKYNEEAE